MKREDNLQLKTLLSSADLGQRVIEKARQLVPELPKKGIFAGQGAASIVMELLGQSGVINDLDVFAFTDENPDFHPKGAKVFDTASISLDMDEYGEILMHNPTNYTTILGSAREGLINRVAIKSDYTYDTETELFFVVNNFDINAVQFGVDLTSGSFYFTEHFQRFLSTNQLYVVNAHTPVATAARLLKKTRELNVYCDLDKEMAFLGKAIMLYNHNVKSYLTPVTAEKYKEEMASLSDYFEPAQFSAFNPNRAGTPQDNAFGMIQYHFTTAFKERLIESINEDKIYHVRSRREETGIRNDGLFISTMAFMSFTVLHHLTRNADLGKGALVKIKTILDKSDTYQLYRQLLTTPTVLIGGNVSGKMVDLAERFYKKHPILCKAFSGVSLENQVKLIKPLNRLEKQGKGWAVGIIESEYMETRDGALIDKLFEVGVKNYIEQHVAATRAPAASLIKPRLLKSFLVNIQQITDSTGLIREGYEMKHCVGGYQRTLEREDSGFFSIRVRRWLGEGRSTLQIKHYAGRYHNVQHFGHSNSRPTQLERVAVEVILARLNGDKLGWRVLTKNIAGKLLQRLNRIRYKFGYKRIKNTSPVQATTGTADAEGWTDELPF